MKLILGTLCAEAGGAAHCGNSGWQCFCVKLLTQVRMLALQPATQSGEQQRNPGRPAREAGRAAVAGDLVKEAAAAPQTRCAAAQTGCLHRSAVDYM